MLEPLSVLVKQADTQRWKSRERVDSLRKGRYLRGNCRELGTALLK